MAAEELKDQAIENAIELIRDASKKSDKLVVVVCSVRDGRVYLENRTTVNFPIRDLPVALDLIKTDFEGIQEGVEESMP